MIKDNYKIYFIMYISVVFELNNHVVFTDTVFKSINLVHWRNHQGSSENKVYVR